MSHVKTNELLKHLPNIGISVLIILSTIAYSSELFDISNIVRYTIQTLSIVILFVCRISMKSYTPFNWGVILFYIFIALQGLSILWATNFGEAIFDFSKWLIIIGIITLTYNGLKRHQVRTVCLLANTAIVLFCLSLIATIPQILQMDGITWNSRYGITSFFTHKGTYSMLLFLFLPFLFLRTRIPLKGKWVYWAFIIFIVALIFFIQARAVLLAICACLCIYFMTKLFKRTNKCHVQWKGLISIIVAIILGFSIVGGCRFLSENRFFGPDAPSSVLSTASMWERQGLWKITFRLIDDKPFTGCGIGNWKIAHPDVSVEDVFSMDILDMEFIRPHNDFLRILAESGYISLFVFLISLSCLLVALVFSNNKNKYETLKAKLSLSFIVGIIIFAIFDFPFDRMELVLWCSIIFGLGIYYSNSRDYLLSRKSVLVLTTTYLLLLGLGIVRWHSEWNYGKVVYYMPKNKWDKIEEYSKKARSFFCNISPNNDPYAYYMGMAREFQGLPSIEEYKLAIKDSPFHKKSLTDLGRVEYLERNDTSAAIRYLKKAISVSPNYSTAYFTLSEVYRREGRKEEALETLNALDLDKKQHIIDKGIKCYFGPQKARSYTSSVIEEERKTKQELIAKISLEQ